MTSHKTFHSGHMAITVILRGPDEMSTFEILTHRCGKNRYINQMWCSVNGAHRMLSWDTYFYIANSKIIASVGEKRA